MNQTLRPRRIVVKVGTSTLAHHAGGPNLHNIELLARTLSDLKCAGHQIVLVSSGAIAIGSYKLGMPSRPTELRAKQAAASVGQSELMHLYDKFFSEYGQTVGQILLTREDVEDPNRADNLRGTFSTLLGMGVVPVVNENDSVSYAEIETGQHKVLGDNDTLSAIVSVFCGADLLVLLTDIDGLYDDDPQQNPNAKLIERVTEITPALCEAAGGAGSQWGTGGMSTKLEAAKIAMDGGVDMVISNGANISCLYRILSGEPVGTLFRA
jgi:glutamate 5-kinase